MLAYYEIKNRGDVYSIVNKKGKWKGAFQAKFTVKDNCMMLFSTKHMEDYFLLETKQQSIQRKMERDALHMILG